MVEEKEKEWVLVRIRRNPTHARLKEMKQTMRFRLLDAVIQLVLKHYTGEYEIAIPKNVMETTVPVVLTGLPLAGKTYFVRHKIIPRIHNPLSVLVVDTAGEYNELPQVKYDIDFHKPQKIRFVPSETPTISTGEVRFMFDTLHMNRGLLKNWIIVIEEGHRYIDIKQLMDFVYESRKFCRKVVVITPNSKEFKGLRTLIVHRSDY